MPVESRQGRARSALVSNLASRLQSWLLIPDGYLPWAKAAARRGGPSGTGGIDAVDYVVAGERASGGIALKRRFHVPWVADFRDPWVGRVTYKPPDAVARRAPPDRSSVTWSPGGPRHGRQRGHGRPLPEAVSGSAGGSLRLSAERIRSGRLAAREQRFRVDGRGHSRGASCCCTRGQLAHRPTARTLLARSRAWWRPTRPRLVRSHGSISWAGTKRFRRKQIRGLSSSGVVEFPIVASASARPSRRCGARQALPPAGAQGGRGLAPLHREDLRVPDQRPSRAGNSRGRAGRQDLIRASSGGVVCGPTTSAVPRETIGAGSRSGGAPGTLPGRCLRPPSPLGAKRQVAERVALRGSLSDSLDSQPANRLSATSPHPFMSQNPLCSNEVYFVEMCGIRPGHPKRAGS